MKTAKFSVYVVSDLKSPCKILEYLEERKSVN